MPMPPRPIWSTRRYAPKCWPVMGPAFTSRPYPRRATLHKSPVLYVGIVARDPYQVLGVAPGASTEELHDAYRRLVKLHHPDRNAGSADSTRRFQEIQRAYDEV